jgi:hypothetical protein
MQAYLSENIFVGMSLPLSSVHASNFEKRETPFLRSLGRFEKSPQHPLVFWWIIIILKSHFLKSYFFLCINCRLLLCDIFRMSYCMYCLDSSQVRGWKPGGVHLCGGTLAGQEYMVNMVVDFTPPPPQLIYRSWLEEGEGIPFSGH